MTARVWSTDAALEPAFERDWNARLADIPHAHFGMRLDWLAWSARLGTPARAALVEDGERRGAIVLRHENGEWVTGWPWRWQLMRVPGADAGPAGLTREDVEWLVQEASGLAGVGRIRAFVPVVDGRRRGFAGGATLLRSLASDDELLAGMGADKRRAVRKCEKAGYQVFEADAHEQFRAYRQLQLDTEARRHEGPASGAADPSLPEPRPGEAWREWELPWQWLLVAVQDGVIRAGSGYGRRPGGTLDYRTNASTPEGLRAGANVLLAWEAMRRGRAQGMRWMNWGGVTMFKRQLGGVLVPIECRLGGHAFWSIPNEVETRMRRARPRVAGWVKAAKVGLARPAQAAESRGLEVWSTRDPLPPAFAGQWEARLAKSPLANYSVRLDHLRFEAEQGRHAVAGLVESEGRRGLVVLREHGRELRCGWPWRWQAVAEGREEAAEPGIPAETAVWLFGRASAVAGRRRLRCYLPCEPASGVQGYVAGNTIVQSITHSDEDLFSAMDANKRRMLRRAERRGYEIAVAGDPAEWLEFAELQARAAASRGSVAEPRDPRPGPGHGYREWELPWMWLQVARFEGRIVAGVGDGLTPGGMVDGRAAAALPEARREGVMSLLCHIEARALRDAGFRWLNHGGDTVFKREIAGTLGARLSMWCWLGGGQAWAVPNRTESWVLRARPRVAAWARALRTRRSRKGKSS